MSNVEFEKILANYLQAIESNDRKTQCQIETDYPQFASDLVSFKRANEEFQDALAGREPIAERSTFPLSASPPFRKEREAVTRVEFRKNSGSTVWSLGRLSQQEFPFDFGDYELLSEIDRGGMGIVFKAKDKSLGMLVALKVVRSGDLATDEELRRFRAEAEATAALKHPNIVRIIKLGEVHGLIYFTMELINGDDLTRTIRDRKLGPREVTRILIKVTDAVAAAHRFGIIHRDLKPSNILVDACGEPYLIDFGLAKFDAQERGFTHTGQILGTPAYMPPEQAKGRRGHTPQTDIYSLGAVLYTAVTGQPPFSGPTSFDILLQVIDREPTAPQKLNKGLPRPLALIIKRAMAKNPADRYATAEKLKADLQRFLLGEPVVGPNLTWTDRFLIWWRREPILVSHLCAIGSVLAIVFVAASSQLLPAKIALLGLWMISSCVFQRLSDNEHRREAAHLSWAAFDIAIYTLLIYLADPPRGLLLIGYPMMIVASGLFYRVSYVVYMTILCIGGFSILIASVTDPITDRVDFEVIYLSGLAVLGFCLISMIRRVRGLTDYSQD